MVTHVNDEGLCLQLPENPHALVLMVNVFLATVSFSDAVHGTAVIANSTDGHNLTKKAGRKYKNHFAHPWCGEQKSALLINMRKGYQVSKEEIATRF